MTTLTSLILSSAACGFQIQDRSHQKQPGKKGGKEVGGGGGDLEVARELTSTWTHS